MLYNNSERKQQKRPILMKLSVWGKTERSRKNEWRKPTGPPGFFSFFPPTPTPAILIDFWRWFVFQSCNEKTIFH